MPTKSTKTKKKPAASKTTATAVQSVRYKKLLTSQWSGNLMLGALVAEMVGAFVLTATVLITSGSIVIATLAMLVLVMAMASLSGGHFNPAITLAMLSLRKVTALRAVCYIIAQLFGAMLAMLVVGQFLATGPADPTTGQPATIFKVQELVGSWRPFFAEALGGVILGVGVAAAALNRREAHEAGFLVGGSLLLGLLVASLASAAIVNPAEAIGLSAYQFGNNAGWTSIWVYALAPILGVGVGTWLYKLMMWDVSNGKKV